MNDPTIRPPHKQQEIHQRIFRAWLKVPELRLSQLIVCANEYESPFYVEDEDFAARIETWASEHESPHAHTTSSEKQQAHLTGEP